MVLLKGSTKPYGKTEIELLPRETLHIDAIWGKLQSIKSCRELVQESSKVIYEHHEYVKMGTGAFELIRRVCINRILQNGDEF